MRVYKPVGASLRERGGTKLSRHNAPASPSAQEEDRPTRPTRVVYGPTDRHIPPRDRCMCPLGGAGRDLCHRARGCRSVGCWASRPVHGARRIAPARTSWTARARHCLGCRPPHGLGWNIRRIQRRCCHQNRRGKLCRFYPHRTNSGRRAYFLIKK